MRKFKLQLDDLVIDSFSTAPVRYGKGTVYGKQRAGGGNVSDASCDAAGEDSFSWYTYYWATCGAETCECPGNNTFWYTCAGFNTWDAAGGGCVYCAG